MEAEQTEMEELRPRACSRIVVVIMNTMESVYMAKVTEGVREISWLFECEVKYGRTYAIL